MRQSKVNNIGPAWKTRARQQARVRPLLLALVGLLTVLGIGAIWYYRTSQHGAVNVPGEAAREEGVTLSAGTKAVLQRLDFPIEIRYYALLDLASATDSRQTFATRVDELLSAYQQAANGKIKVTRFSPRSDSNAAAALADGLTPFNLDKGDACYLGLVLVHNGQKESFPQLNQEWEQALEPDLSRAITRLIHAAVPVKATTTSSQLDPAAIAEVKRQLPNFASVSVEEGNQVLRELALKDFQTAVREMELQLREAEQSLSKTQNGKSEAEQQAAMKHLQRVQAENAEKLKQIAARSMAQIEALRQLKESAR